MENKEKKELFFEKFNIQRETAKELFDEKTVNISDEIVELIKSKKPTYEQAYAALELSFKQLRFESNFVSVV